MKDLMRCHVRFACLLAVAALTAACRAPQAMQSVTGLPAASAPVAAAPTSMLAGTHTPGVAAQPATTTIPTAFDSPLETPPAGPTATSAGTLVGQPFTSPIETPLAPISGTWRVFTLPVGVSFKYPANWQILHLTRGPGELINFLVCTNDRSCGVSLQAMQLPWGKEPAVYHHTGDEIPNRDGPTPRVIWDEVVIANALEWHVDIAGTTDYTGTGRSDLDDLANKGAINANATLRAIHYEQRKGLLVMLMTGLTPDMLVAIDQHGPDVIFPDQVKVFNEILNGVSIDP